MRKLLFTFLSIVSVTSFAENCKVRVSKRFMSDFPQVVKALRSKNYIVQTAHIEANYFIYTEDKTFNRVYDDEKYVLKSAEYNFKMIMKAYTLDNGGEIGIKLINEADATETFGNPFESRKKARKDASKNAAENFMTALNDKDMCHPDDRGYFQNTAHQNQRKESDRSFHDKDFLDSYTDISFEHIGDINTVTIE